MNNRNYSTIHTIKKFAMDEIAPKYFNMTEINDLNVGALGFINEYIGTITEDSHNTITTYLNEMFPHLAILPETIYNNAAMFQIDGSFGSAAECTMYLFIPEADVINNGVKNGDVYEFILDSDMLIDVENINYMMDYSVKIKYKIPSYVNDYVFTAEYMMEKYGGTYTNKISKITSPYTKIKRVNFENTSYLQIEVKTHQVNRYSINDNVISSDIINLPVYTIEFDDYLANFDVFYKAPNETTYTQLEKRLSGTAPISFPFCYYKMVDEGEMEISFSSRDNYFTPAYNSEIIIVYHTTIGEKANFDSYVGTDIQVIPSSEIYDYNNTLTVFAIPMGGSYNGVAPMTLDQLKRQTVELFSTVGSYTNENDLQVYFDNFNNKFNSNILFIKSRDDIFERRFSSFTLFKNDTDIIFNTNTLNLEINTQDFDSELEQSAIHILKPGHLFTYKPGISDTAIINYGNVDEYALLDEPFVYSNPFLIYFAKNPTSIGYYLNSVDDKYTVDYVSADKNSLVQFTCNQISVSRNAIIGDSGYKIELVLTPTSELDNPMVIEETDELSGEKNITITNSIKVKLVLTDNGVEVCYYNMELSSYDLDLGIYTFSCVIETDDYITLTNKFRVTNALDMQTDIMSGSHLIPMNNSVINIYTYYNENVYNHIPTHTNKYTTKTHPITFIEPIEMINSSAIFVSNNDGVIDTETGLMTNGTYHVNIKSVPLVEAATLADVERSKDFIRILRTQYEYLINIIDKITNNYSIDVKFYNTYGKSKNFYVDDSDNVMRLDKVNIRIKFEINPVFGVDDVEFISDIKLFIKNYVENINDNGTNSIYISNLIRELENNFSSINYLKFEGINDYSTDIQVIENQTIDLTKLTKEDRINYVPEYLTLALEDITIIII